MGRRVQQQTSVEASFELNRRWRPALMAFFMRRVRDFAEAEDLTQEVFVRVMAAETDVRRPDAFVFQIAANLLLDRARKSRVRERYRAEAAFASERAVDYLDPHAIAAAREQMSDFIQALEALPERLRTMFVLYRFENMSQEMIGATYGISASAVKQQLAKAMAQLTRRMRDSG